MSDVVDVGDIRMATLEVEDGSPDTVATCTVYPPRGVSFVQPATSDDDGVTWQAEITYTVAGLWRFFWQVTEDGDPVGTAWQQVSVTPSPVAVGRRYADTADLAEYLGTAVPDDAELLLVRATEAVDRLLFGAVYDVTGADEMPSDTGHRAAVKLATCAVVQWWVETGDPVGAAGRYQSVSINGVSLSRAGGAGGTTGAAALADLIGGGAARHLAQAGLLGHAPRVYSR